jgi:glycosyltransferase involved in cell wall biosynthesis
MKKNFNICIVIYSLSQVGRAPLSNLVRLFSALANRVYVVSGVRDNSALENGTYLDLNANVHLTKVIHKVDLTLLMRIINYMYVQLKILCYITIASRQVDDFVFFLAGEFLFIPILVLKLLRKKVVLMLAGVSTKEYSIGKDPFRKFVSLITGFSLSLANKLIIYSHKLASEEEFVRYQGKIITAHEHFLDFSKFTMAKKVYEKQKIVGFLGRLSEEKGILDFIRAMPLIVKRNKDAYFVVGGVGNLFGKIVRMIKDEGLEAHVKLVGWVPYEDIPLYLNRFRLLVLPSFTEGLPNILLEAMACGTAVLATAVGAIPDIIKDGETGFLLKSTNPEYIAERIIELLNKPKLLEKVSVNAYWYVRENFRYEETLEAWRKVFRELGIGKRQRSALEL